MGHSPYPKQTFFSNFRIYTIRSLSPRGLARNSTWIRTWHSHALALALSSASISLSQGTASGIWLFLKGPIRGTSAFLNPDLFTIVTQSYKIRVPDNTIRLGRAHQYLWVVRPVPVPSSEVSCAR